jgi:citrate lyase alpha subunit
MIAELVIKVIEHSGFFKNGYSFQTEAGAIAIARIVQYRDGTVIDTIKQVKKG